MRTRTCDTRINAIRILTLGSAYACSLSCTAANQREISNVSRPRVHVEGNPAKANQLPPARNECQEPGPEWEEGQVALEDAFKRSFGSKLEVRRTHRPIAYEGTMVVTIEESARGTQHPIAVIYVGDKGGYVTLIGAEEQWYCVGVERGALTLFRSPTILDPTLQPTRP